MRGNIKWDCGGENWKLLTILELKAFIEIRFLMALKKQPNKFFLGIETVQYSIVH